MEIKSEKERSSPVSVQLPDYGITVFESKHSADFSMNLSAHDYHQAGLVLSGKGKIVVEGYSNPGFDILENTFFYIPLGAKHAFSDNQKEPLVLQMICFSHQAFMENKYAEDAIQVFRSLWMKQPFISLGKSFVYQKITTILKEMSFEQTSQEAGYELSMKYLVWQLVNFINRLKRHQQPELNSKEQGFLDSLTYLHNYFYKSPSVKDLAQIAGMSYRGYTDYFKLKKSCTVLQYITNLKIEYAKKRLGESRSIEFAAYEAGFNDITNFYRVFKRYTAQTPKQFLVREV